MLVHTLRRVLQRADLDVLCNTLNEAKTFLDEMQPYLDERSKIADSIEQGNEASPNFGGYDASSGGRDESGDSNWEDSLWQVDVAQVSDPGIRKALLVARSVLGNRHEASVEGDAGNHGDESEEALQGIREGG